MDLITIGLEVLRFGAGLILVAALGRYPKANLAGGLLAGITGGCAIPMFFIWALLVRTKADLDVLCPDLDRNFSERDVWQIVHLKATGVALGLVVAAVCSAIGWTGWSTLAINISVVLVLLWRMGPDLVFWGLLLFVGGATYAGQAIGCDSAPMLVLLMLSTLPTRIHPQTPDQVYNEGFIVDLGLLIAGVFGGVVPALDARIIVRSENNHWFVSAVALGASLGLNLFQRSSSKSAASATLAQFAPDLDPIWALVTIAVVLCGCLAPGSIRAMFRYATSAPPKWMFTILNFSAATWYATTADGLIVGVAIAGTIYALSAILGRSPRLLPPGFINGIQAAPVLLL